jgi:general secretion pathway protein G
MKTSLVRAAAYRIRSWRPKSQSTLPRSSGMTLLELMIACSILMVLATVALPLERATIIRKREDLLHYDLRQMRDAIDRYKDAADKNLIMVEAGTEGYPPDLQTLVTGVTLSGGNGAGLGAGLGTNVNNLSTSTSSFSAFSQGGITTNNNKSKTDSAASRHIRFLREIPVDPMTGKADWGMRSVQDDADSTSWGGQDVFDVYSMSSGTALDTTKYSTW